MKNKDNLEDLLRRRLENEEFHVSERVWENVKKTLPPERKNWRPYFIYFFGTIAATGLIAAFFFILPGKKEESLIKESEFINSQAFKDPVTEEIREGQEKDFSKKDISSLEVSETNKSNRSENYQSTKNENSDLSDPLQLIKKESNLENKYNVNIWRIGKISKNILIKKSLGVLAPKVKKADSSKIKVIPINEPYITLNDYDINDLEIEKLANSAKQKIPENTSSINSNRSGKSELTLNKDYIDTLNLRSVNTINFRKKESKKETLDSLDAEKLNENQCNSKKKKENKTFLSHPISIDIFANPLISYRTISASSNVKSDLDANEKPRINIGAGIKINFDLNAKWKIGLGINYNSYGERFKFGKDFYKEKTAYFGYYQQDSSGAFVVKTDSSKYIEKYNAKYKNNYYKYIGIPFYITRVLSNGKFGVAVSAGASINFLISGYTSRVSSLTDTAIAIIEESSHSANSPFRKTVVSAILASTISYEIGTRGKVFLEPGITYFINSTYKSDYPIKRNIYGFQLMAGIRYILKD